MKWIRKLFGCRPKLGDTIAAGLDFGVSFTGVVVQDKSSCEYMPGYVCNGTVHISNMWKGKIEEQEEGFFVPLARARLL